MQAAHIGAVCGMTFAALLAIAPPGAGAQALPDAPTRGAAWVGDRLGKAHTGKDRRAAHRRGSMPASGSCAPAGVPCDSIL